MNIYKHTLGTGREIFYIENKNIKTVILWIMYYMPLDNRASMNALLSKILLRGSNNYRSMKSISEFLYSNYGASFGTDINLKGEIYTFSIFSNFINDKLLPGNKRIFKSMMSFLKDILYNPLMEDDVFNEKILETEISNLVSIIEGKKNNKDSYSFDRCIELMCREEPYGIDKLGKIDWVYEIANDRLWRHYREIINKMPFKIYVMGDLDFNEIVEMLQIDFNDEEVNQNSVENVKPQHIEKKEFVEEGDISQSKLCIGFRTGIDLRDKDFLSLIIFNKLFGGGPQSLLFKKIREELGLCYNIFTVIEKYKGLLFTICGTDKEKEIIVRDNILKIFEDIKAGRFSEGDLISSIHSCKRDYEDVKMDNYSYISFLQGLNIYKCNYSLEDLIQKLGDVTREDVINCSKRIKLDTIYILKGR